MNTSSYDIFNRLKNKKIIVSFHQNGDPDAVGSAVALREILKQKYNCQVNIVFDSVSKISETLLEEVKINLTELSDFKNEYDFIILVDTNNPAQLGEIGLTLVKDKVILIDHHLPHSELAEFSDTHIIKPEYPATSQIIFEISEYFNTTLSKASRFLLLAGIIYDSRYFTLINTDTFLAAYKLVRTGLDYDKLLFLLNPLKDRSEKIARLKAVKRMELYEAGEWIIAVSKLGSFEASASRAFIQLGADLAIVANISKDAVRISSRASTEFYKKTGLNLAKDLMEPIGPIIKGQGGGHSTAAGCNGTINGEDAIEKIKEILAEKLHVNLKKISVE
ncbi:MAG: bifunctional oligoribonuclease/PAP phosphatase NrnA [Candidatus Odinarchaeum yellowstonii]|uniref:Bifunctional oligoribonuclease/PAP phosphatase NrnA n=1 Tax=Odinarchaeota yellowstonii (strain LCB_4) TaxID=1841599 RepID=A0AAF0IB99_ODILC|nr:MAG: bifunctional oligoribonuclease/PAP phosphatase NrnA [Candidatus Odinarchaeum yellowstonii]